MQEEGFSLYRPYAPSTFALRRYDSTVTSESMLVWQRKMNTFSLILTCIAVFQPGSTEKSAVLQNFSYISEDNAYV